MYDSVLYGSTRLIGNILISDISVLVEIYNIFYETSYDMEIIYKTI